MYTNAVYSQSAKDEMLRQQLILDTAEKLRRSGLIDITRKPERPGKINHKRGCGIVSPLFTDMDFY